LPIGDLRGRIWGVSRLGEPDVQIGEETGVGGGGFVELGLVAWNGPSIVEVIGLGE